MSLFQLQLPFSCIIQNCLVKRQVSKGKENFQFILNSGPIWQCFDTRNSRICDKLLNVEWTRNRLWFNCCRCFNCKFPFSCIIQNCLVKSQVSKGNIFEKFCFVSLVSAIDTNQINNNVKMSFAYIVFLFHFKMSLSKVPYWFWRMLFCFVVAG